MRGDYVTIKVVSVPDPSSQHGPSVDVYLPESLVRDVTDEALTFQRLSVDVCLPKSLAKK